MAKALTVKTLENLKPTAARQELPDGLIRGLFYVLQPTGKASWAVRYRHQRQTRKLTLGTYPAIDLKAARELASRALVNVAGGADPAAEKQIAKDAERIPIDQDLIEKVVTKFIERYAKVNAVRFMGGDPAPPGQGGHFPLAWSAPLGGAPVRRARPA